MLNCKDMTKLISDSLERKITLRERMELWLHIMMCGMCRKFRRNAIALRMLVRREHISKEKLADSAAVVPDSQTLSSSAKERISSAIRQQLG